jgi:hypothetical protein
MEAAVPMKTDMNIFSTVVQNILNKGKEYEIILHFSRLSEPRDNTI